MRLAIAIATIALIGRAPAVSAQDQLGVTADVRSRPGGPVVAAVMPGARIVIGASSGSNTQVTFEGWVDGSRLGAQRDSFPASVSGRLTLRVRSAASPNASVVAVLQPGAGVHVVSRQGTWTRVRRTAWIAGSALQRATAAETGTAARTSSGNAGAGSQANQGASAQPRQLGPVTEAPSNSIVAARGARIHDLPIGNVIGGLASGTAVEILGRQPGWVRVRTDGWIAESDLIAGGGTPPPAISAADLRADPPGMKGKIVQWEVEIMSLERADPLRIEMAREEPYLLARGPGEENAVLYLAVPPSLLDEARALEPLSRVTVTAKVRSGRSEPAGTPILDLISIVRR